MEKNAEAELKHTTIVGEIKVLINRAKERGGASCKAGKKNPDRNFLINEAVLLQRV